MSYNSLLDVMLVIRSMSTKTNQLPAGLGKKDRHCSVEKLTSQPWDSPLWITVAFPMLSKGGVAQQSNDKNERNLFKRNERHNLQSSYIRKRELLFSGMTNLKRSSQVNVCVCPMWLWLIGLTLAHKPALFTTGILSRPTVDLGPTESKPEFSFRFEGAAYFHAGGCVLLSISVDACW